MCEVMIVRVPAAMAARNGTNSRSRRVSRGRSTTGRARCESVAVSPCPGKCFALAATPVDWSPRTHAAAWRAASAGSAPKLRTPITGLSGLEFTSTSGANATVHPVATRASPTARATRSVRSRSSMRPSSALPGYGAPRS